MTIYRKGSPSRGSDQREYWPTYGWRNCEPEDQGMNSGLLLRLEQHIKENQPQIGSVLIVRRGYLVFEKYYWGNTWEHYQDVFSVTKSFISALVGVALEKGYLHSLDQKVITFFSEYVSPRIAHQVKEITLKHLLTMTSGFGEEPSTLFRTMNSRNWMKFIINLPPVSKPGQMFNQSTSAVHLLSGVLTKATKMSTLEFADSYLFEPLGIPTPSWTTDPQGYYVGGFGLTLKPRDMAKFGHLYLNNGFWDGRQVVPAEWVKESTQKQREADYPAGENYGYLWWVTSVKGHPAYYAAGFGGQFIYVIPNLDMVVVITSDFSSLGLENKAIVDLFIVPAAQV